MKIKNLFKISLYVWLLLPATAGSANAQQAGTPPSLKNLLNAALEKNYQLQNRQLSARQAESDLKKVQSSYLPRVNLNGSYTHLNDELTFPDDLNNLLKGTQGLLVKEQNGMPFNAPLPENTPLQDLPAIQDQNFLRADVTGSVLLFSGLKVPMLSKAARHQVSALKWQTARSRAKIIMETASLYNKLAVLWQSEKVLEQSRTLLQEKKRFVEGALANGLATPLDRRKIELAEEELQARQLEFEMGRELLVAKMAQLTGYAETQLQQIRPKLQEQVTVVPQNSIMDRYDLKALQEGANALNYRRKASMANYLPKVAAFGKYELLQNSLTLLDPRWAVGLKLQWHIFDGLDAKREAQKHKLEQLKMQNRREEAVELLDLNLKQTTLELEKQQQLVNMARKRAANAQELLEMSSKEYRAGLSSLNDYLGSVRDREEAELKLVSSLYNLRMARLNRLEATEELHVAAFVQ